MARRVALTVAVSAVVLVGLAAVRGSGGGGFQGSVLSSLQASSRGYHYDEECSSTSGCGSCGDGCKECDHQDCGSCGGACCTLIFHFTTTDSTEAVAEAIRHPIKSYGGPDGRFSLGETAEGDLGFADLKPYNKSVDYIGRFQHETTGGCMSLLMSFLMSHTHNSSLFFYA